MKRTTIRVVTVGLAAGLIAAGLAGCGQKNGGGSASTGDTLVYRSIWSAEEPQAKILQAALDDFAKENSVKVDVKFLGRSGGDALTTEMAAGQGPDLFDAGSDNLPAWRAQNLAAPIDDVLKMEVPGEKGTTVGDVIPKAVITAASDDKGLGFLPHTAISTAVWFDAKAHPELQANPPKTWDEFIAYLDSAKSAGRVPICQDGTIPFYNVYWLSSAIVNANGAGSLLALQKDAKAWDGADIRTAAEQVAQLAKGGYFESNFMATKYPAAQNDWIAGKCDLNINGTWLASEVAPATPAGAEIRSFQLPVGGEQSIEAGALGLGVNAKGKHIELAKKFLAFFEQKKYQELIGSEAKNIPARSDVPAPDALAGLQKSLAGAKSVHLTYDAAAGVKAWWNDLFLPLDDQLLSGQISADEFLSQGKDKTAQYLASQK
ncbi:ABC transporter substrate-binding protein [Microbacterium sp. NPDC089698]|jgi:raffinose/stachyose/melibiose transport system substrate-binding protein|uniref:ABC transporter substrate-binding protein n=1 Tax=unclassified Microbacterium TaxID=2609290 RepID=UPI00282460C6|nr:extracellular solute-binding protein [Microbacterium sp.]MDR2322064.1 extracellular solute-binding protein [Microbacterium sp.]